jgi:hypothetical protein
LPINHFVNRTVEDEPNMNLTRIEAGDIAAYVSKLSTRFHKYGDVFCA